MSDALTLAAEARTEFGKGFARRARAAGKIPAVIYGHGTDPVHVTLPAHDTAMALKHPNALLTIELGKDSQLAIAKDVQRDPVKRIIEHIDLIIVKKGEKITVDVPLHVVGESAPGTIHIQDHTTLQVIAEATHIPEGFEANIEGLEEGHNLTAGQIELPKGVELVTDPDAIVVNIAVPRAAVADEAEEAAAEGGAAAEGEAAEAAEAPEASE
ncbi:50S ribosomal protein L25/general stress protein Ctc [Demequina sp.]|uniref:50S ribosomal protein L25/general stress protein Ctc n=1 Tax=Demequina sp. TaxID=2050685 RepID=UPI003D115424